MERRRRYIERQIALEGAGERRFRGQPPEGSGPVNRHGMPKLPVGQHEVKNWPVLDLGEQPEVDLETGGSTSRPGREPGHADLGPSSSRCRRSTMSAIFTASRRGAATTTIGAACGSRRSPSSPCRPTTRASCSAPATTSCRAPTSLHDERAARARDRRRRAAGAHLGRQAAAARARRPVPDDHAEALCVERREWIRKIDFLPTDQKGFWEVRGYSNSAEPWFNDRYSWLVLGRWLVAGSWSLANSRRGTRIPRHFDSTEDRKAAVASRGRPESRR